MSDEKRRIFTHPDVVQAGDYYEKYRASLVCSVCHLDWGKHIGWACDGPYIGSLPEQPSRVSTTCARCSATIDPATVEQHHERCFRVGDEVRWQVSDRWAEGTVIEVPASSENDLLMIMVMRSSSGGCPYRMSYTRKNIRHIQRPGQAVVSGCAFIHGESDRIAAVPVGSYRTPHVLSVKVTTPEPNCTINGVPAYCPPPAPTLYDGLTAEQCLERYIAQQHDKPPVWHVRWRSPISGQTGLGDPHPSRAIAQRHADFLTEEATSGLVYTVEPSTLKPAQLAAARDLWQQQLRARISAAKERERLTVRVDDQGEP